MRRIRLIGCFVAFLVLALFALFFPSTAIAIALFIGQFVPSLIWCGIFTYLCKNRDIALLVMALGTFIGFLLTPSFETIRENQIWLDDFLTNRIYCAVFMGGGTFITGFLVYMIECMQRRSK